MIRRLALLAAVVAVLIIATLAWLTRTIQEL